MAKKTGYENNDNGHKVNRERSLRLDGSIISLWIWFPKIEFQFHLQYINPIYN